MSEKKGADVSEGVRREELRTGTSAGMSFSCCVVLDFWRARCSESVRRSIIVLSL